MNAENMEAVTNVWLTAESAKRFMDMNFPVPVRWRNTASPMHWCKGTLKEVTPKYGKVLPTMGATHHSTRLLEVPWGKLRTWGTHMNKQQRELLATIVQEIVTHQAKPQPQMVLELKPGNPSRESAGPLSKNELDEIEAMKPGFNLATDQVAPQIARAKQALDELGKLETRMEALLKKKSETIAWFDKQIVVTQEMIAKSRMQALAMINPLGVRPEEPEETKPEYAIRSVPRGASLEEAVEATIKAGYNPPSQWKKLPKGWVATLLTALPVGEFTVRDLNTQIQRVTAKDLKISDNTLIKSVAALAHRVTLKKGSSDSANWILRVAA